MTSKRIDTPPTLKGEGGREQKESPLGNETMMVSLTVEVQQRCQRVDIPSHERETQRGKGGKRRLAIRVPTE